jgi:hypothetical protein
MPQARCQPRPEAGSDRRPSRQAGLPAGQRSSTVAACARARPGQVRDRRSPTGRPPQHRPLQADSGRRPSRSGPADHLQPDPSRPQGCPPPDVIPTATAGLPPTRRGPGGRTPAGRTVGPRTTEPADRTPDSWTSDGWTPDGWTTGPRPWEPDGWTPNGGRGPARDGMAGAPALPASSDARPLGAVRKLHRSDATWSIRNQDSSAERTLGHCREGLTTGVTRQRQGDTTAQGAPRRIALLGRLRVERRANGDASSVMAILERLDNGVEWAGLYVAHVGMVEPWWLSISVYMRTVAWR